MVALADNIATEGASLRFSRISKDFPSADNPDVRIAALDNVSLSIAAGDPSAVRSP